MNRLKKLLDNNEIFANIGIVASTICIIFVIPIDREYSVSFFILVISIILRAYFIMAWKKMGYDSILFNDEKK